jgi:hypothetical protein
MQMEKERGMLLEKRVLALCPLPFHSRVAARMPLTRVKKSCIAVEKIRDNIAEHESSVGIETYVKGRREPTTRKRSMLFFTNVIIGSWDRNTFFLLAESA